MPDGFCVVITDLLSMKLYLKLAASKNAVVGIDATGIGKTGNKKDSKQVFLYSMTVDISDEIKRSDSQKIGTLSVLDFIVVGRGVTTISMIQFSLQQFKNICISACKRWEAPKYCKLDGELSLLEGAKILGSDTRRLVELYHARKNIKHDILEIVKEDMETFTVIMELWNLFLESNSLIEAQTIVEEMKNKISSMDKYNTQALMRPFKAYWEDTSMVCKYALRDVPKKHYGPAEVEGYFDKLKHDYIEETKSMNRIDDILWSLFCHRQRMEKRYLEDNHNNKKIKGVKEVKERYAAQRGIDLSKTRKSPRKRKVQEEAQEAEGVLESPQKKQKEDESFIKPPVKRALFSDDADYNTVYGSQPVTSPGITKFSKDKNIQRIQVQKLRKHYKEKLQVVRDDVRQAVASKKQTIPGNPVSAQESESQEDEANMFSEISSQSSGLREIENILFTESTVEPNFEIWKSLETVDLGVRKIKAVGLNRYYEIQANSSIAGMISLLFGMINSEENSTDITNQAFKYIWNTIEKKLYLFIILMTNKGCKRNKTAPFCLEIVSKIQSDGKDQSTSEGFFHLQPRKESIKEGSALRNKLLVTADTSSTLKTLIKKITTSFSASIPNQTSDASPSQDANKLDRELHPDSFVLLRYAITLFY